jgi:hypothetical protein
MPGVFNRSGIDNPIGDCRGKCVTKFLGREFFIINNKFAHLCIHFVYRISSKEENRTKRLSIYREISLLRYMYFGFH